MIDEVMTVFTSGIQLAPDTWTWFGVGLYLYLPLDLDFLCKKRRRKFPRCLFTSHIIKEKSFIFATQSRYIPVHIMYRAEFHLVGQAVQYKYRIYEAKRDGTPTE